MTVDRSIEFNKPASPQEPLNEHRILMATDVPFWRKSTGAQQRIASLVRYLESVGFVVRTFYLGQSGTGQFTESDRKLIAQQRLDVEQRSSEQQPNGLARKIGWYADATLHHLFRSSRSNQSESPKSSDSGQEALQLEDFRWPWAMNAFAEAVVEFKPESIIVQYIKLGYLLDGLPPQTRNETKCLVDTHDALHQRSDQFQQRGYQHWIHVNRDQESTELKKFDSIIAIQDEEAELFREMAPDCEIIVCGHATYLEDRLPSQIENIDHKFTIGYLGSLNASNIHAMELFLKKAWSVIQESEISDRINLLIAGEICSWLESHDDIGPPNLRNVRLLGMVDHLGAFYDRIDMAINPVEFGTGLKIKNCEAIAHGKPLMTTGQGMLGMPAGCERASVACESIPEFAEALATLVGDPEQMERLRASATQLSQTEFSDQQAYSRLKQSLIQAK